MGCSDADLRLCDVSTDDEAVDDREASISAALDINLSSLLSCSSLDISLYSSEESPSQALFSDIERFILSRSTFEALAAASISSADFFLLSFI